MPQLLVIAGPIGSGKSATADALTTVLAAQGLAAVAVDLDDLAFAQRGGVSDLVELWRRAAIAAAALVRGWFDAGADVVVAHGPFFEAGGYELLSRGVGDVGIRHVLLRVPVEVALERVAGDPDRGVSKDPDFLREMHLRFSRIEESLPQPLLVFDTVQRTASEIAGELAAGILAG